MGKCKLNHSAFPSAPDSLGLGAAHAEKQAKGSAQAKVLPVRIPEPFLTVHFFNGYIDGLGDRLDLFRQNCSL